MWPELLQVEDEEEEEEEEEEGEREDKVCVVCLVYECIPAPEFVEPERA